VNGYAAIREDAWKIDYVFRTLRPQPGLRLVLRSTDGSERQVDAMAELRPRTQDPWQLIDQYEHMWQDHRPKYQEFGNKAIVVRLLDFAFDNDRANEILDKVRSHEALILDLRGNPGGYVDFLIRFLGGMFDHEVKIANPVGRKPMKPSLTRTRGGKTFTGKLVVLIDSRSASASELFARVVQLARRGIVVGDRSSGKVMESRIHVHEVGTNGGMFRFALAITEADMVMSDGKSLEHTGVLPDERVLPSPADMAAGRDPALSRAAALVGVELTPEAAGKLFPAEWPKE
jgi:C-terminal processing protease CtpA/Prc